MPKLKLWTATCVCGETVPLEVAVIKAVKCRTNDCIVFVCEKCGAELKIPVEVLI